MYSSFQKQRCRRLQLPTMALAALLCSPAVTLSQAEPISKEQQGLRDAFTRQYGQHFDTSQLTQYLNHLFRTVDFDRQGISEPEIVVHRQMQAAKIRAQAASQILHHDLDGDGVVTRAEVETTVRIKNTRYGRSASAKLTEIMMRRIKKQVDQVLQGDPNKDGRIEPSEYGALAKQKRFTRHSARRNHSPVASALLALDPNQDGSVTQVEAMSIMAKAFEGVKISPMPRMSGVGALPGPSCKAPAVPAGAEVVVVGAYEGSSVPTVSVAGQDAETSTSKLIVEKGEKPLYILMTSYTPMIWRLTGATQRIVHAVVAGRPVRGKTQVMAGVTGLAKDKVTFVSTRNCMRYFHKTGGIPGARAKAVARKLAGRDPEHLFGAYSLHEMQIPSGSHKKAKNSRRSGLRIISGNSEFQVVSDENGSKAVKVLENGQSRPGLERSLLRFNPGGVIKIDPKTVVSDDTAKAYNVLPQEAGLLQLVSSGALEIISSGQFKIVKKIRYPAGLNGSHGVKFLLKAGVPEPDGHPGHSCVFSEDVGEPIAGICR